MAVLITPFDLPAHLADTFTGIGLLPSARWPESSLPTIHWCAPVHTQRADMQPPARAASKHSRQLAIGLGLNRCLPVFASRFSYCFSKGADVGACRSDILEVGGGRTGLWLCIRVCEPTQQRICVRVRGWACVGVGAAGVGTVAWGYAREPGACPPSPACCRCLLVALSVCGRRWVRPSRTSRCISTMCEMWHRLSACSVSHSNSLRTSLTVRPRGALEHPCLGVQSSSRRSLIP